MNPSAWNNPPPPGTDMEEEESKASTLSYKASDYLDQIDPYIKNPEYVKYKKSLSKERTHRRSRSRSHDRYRTKKKYRSRSRSKNRHRRSRSRSKEKRRRRCSSSSSSSSHGRHRYRSKPQYSSRSRKYSRSRSKSRDRNNRHKRRREIRHHKSRSHSHSDHESFIDAENIKKEEEEEIDEPSKENAYKNDGSFLEMFKKMQEEKIKTEADANEASGSEPKKLLPTFGKRRGGRVLKTGMVEKPRINDDEDAGTALDPWSIYLKEVKKYKEACCDDDSKTRPLVK